MENKYLKVAQSSRGINKSSENYRRKINKITQTA